MAQDMNNLKSRRSFDASFKLHVVQIIKAQGLSSGQVGLPDIGKPIKAE